jgi:hypothetical protein
MDENYDIYYVDNARNATVRDHTGNRVFSPFGGNVPATTRGPAGIPPLGRAPTAYAQPYAQPPTYPQSAYPMVYSPTAYPYGAAPVPYGQTSTIFAPQSLASSIFGRITAGQVIEMIAQGFAAIQGVPTPPVATGDVATDIENNGKYNVAVAEAVKSDERTRTLGSILAYLAGK